MTIALSENAFAFHLIIPQIVSTPIWGVRVDLGVENGINRNLGPTFLCDFYTVYRLILHRLASIRNAADSNRWQYYAIALAA